jgi:hypothetical protein
VLVDGPPRGHEQRLTFDCTESRLGPIVDSVFTAFFLYALADGLTETEGEGEGESGRVGPLILTGALAAVAASSGVYGFLLTHRCRCAKGELLARREAMGRPATPEPAPPAPLAKQEPDDPRGQRRFGVDLSAGSYGGQGGGVRFELGPVGVRASAVWLPVMTDMPFASAVFLVPVTKPRRSHELFMAWQANADLHVLVLRVTSRSEIGLEAGYRYSSLLGHGGAAGAHVEIDRGRRLTFFGSLGYSYFPGGERRLLDEADYPADTDVSRALFGLSVGMTYHP